MWFGWLACGAPATDSPATTATGSAADTVTTPAEPAVASSDALAPGEGPGPGEAPLRFAVIGDYGDAGPDEEAVAAMVASWSPDLIVTNGDNNYPSGHADTIDANIGQYYHAWIGGYHGAYGTGSVDNRFLACLGNHDWYADDDLAAWYDYFSLPNNERYYATTWGSILFVCLDSDIHEPDSIARNGIQAGWARDQMMAATTPYVIPFFHHPPLSSGTHGSTFSMTWPFSAWGADIVLTGHDHQYERLGSDGVQYLVQGLGGASVRVMGTTLPSSQVAWTGGFGATLGELRGDILTFTTWSVDGTVIDTVRLDPTRQLSVEPMQIRYGSTWSVLGLGQLPDGAWAQPGYDDSAWAPSLAPIGWGILAPITDLDPAVPPVAVYHRTTFEVADLTTVGAAFIEVLADDGFVAYLNGTEIGRGNLPAGPILPNTLATMSVLIPPTVSITVPMGLVTQGTNTLAVEVHQAKVDDTDAIFDASVRLAYTPRLVASGAEWRYIDTGVAPAASWNTSAFSDDDWKLGASPLGYGVDPLGTAIGYGGNAANRTPTTWFRNAFSVPDPSALNAVILRVRREDGAAVWINGVEVWRGNLPPIAAADALAPTALPKGWADPWVETFVDASLFVAGDNVVAAEMHRGTADGTTLRFDLELAPL